MPHDDDTSNGWLEIVKRLEKKFDMLDDDQKELVKDLLDNEFDYNEMMDTIWYKYDRPNYGKMSQPIAKWLKPLTQADLETEIHDICLNLAKEAKAMDKHQVANDLKNFVFRYLAYLNNDIDDAEGFNNSEYAYPLYGIFWLMAHFHLDFLLDVAFETLKQKSDILQFIYSMGEEETGSAIIYELGKQHMDKLDDYLRATGFIPFGKTIVFDALAYIYANEPKLKLKSLNYISNYLRLCQKIGMEGGDMTNVDHYASTLAKVKAKETLPLLKKIYDTTEVPNIEIEDYDDLVEKMNEEEYNMEDTFILMDDIIFDIQEFANGEFEEYPDDDIFEDLFDLDKD